MTENRKEDKSFSFTKIAENAITTLVAAVFIGACVIVWNGATSVDTRVKSTEQSLSGLIDNLSDKLAKYEVQLTVQSNQLQAISKELTNLNYRLISNPVISPTRDVILKSTEQQTQQTEQKARRADIYRELQKK